MQRFLCPDCRARLDIGPADGKATVSCPGCGLGAVLEYNRNHDEVYLDFLYRFDRGEIGERDAGDPDPVSAGKVRSEAEIREMIGSLKPDKLTLAVLQSQKDYISDYRRMDSPPPEMGSRVDDLGLNPGIVQGLADSGIERLYRFQEEAVRGIIAGDNVVIESPTASGKTEAFVVPILQSIAGRGLQEGILALLVYPTKALARDQLPKIRRYAERLGIRAEVFDGDTPDAERRKIMDRPPQMLITNFDVLHYHMCHRTGLASLLGTVRFLVADEVHTYSGIFGSNVHYVIKRLGRIAAGMQFVAASATLDNAAEFCRRLFGTEMRHVCGSGRRGSIEFAMILPTLRKRSSLMVDVAKRLTQGRHRTIIFNNTHRSVELFAMQAKNAGINIMVHRAGLNPGYRNLVESEFRSGRLQAISSTSTLELGIDIGSVDGVISSPVPINRLMQRMGRAARKGQRGYAFLALGDDPISQYYGNHPGDYFTDVEKAYIDPKNPFVERLQILAMACDRPIRAGEMPGHDATLQEQVRAGNLRRAGSLYVPSRKAQKLLGEYNIRGIGSSVYITLDGKRLGHRALPIALEELHSGAIYFLAGRRYLVAGLDYPDGMSARLQRIPEDHSYYTKALTSERPTIDDIYETRSVFGMEVAFCGLRIRKTVGGYLKIALGQDADQGEAVSLDEPLEYDLVTKGIVFHAPRPLDSIAESEDAGYVEAGGYHAAEHIIIEGSNMITGGASRDLGGISLGTSGLIFVYDGAVGGNGASWALYDRLEEALARSMRIAADCSCSHRKGCPRCTFSYRCGNNNDFLHRCSALEILRRINAGEPTKLTAPAQDDRALV